MRREMVLSQSKMENKMQNIYQIKEQSEVLILDKDYMPETKIVIGEELTLFNNQVDGPHEFDCGNCNNRFYFAEICPAMIVQVNCEDVKCIQIQ